MTPTPTHACLATPAPTPTTLFMDAAAGVAPQQQQPAAPRDAATAAAQAPVSPGFEGAEKCLRLAFSLAADDCGDAAAAAACPDGTCARAASRGLRALARAQLDQLMTLARCTIVSHTACDEFDSYVLSESSLFVYPDQFIIKTCGTTTLLRCVPQLLQFAHELRAELRRVVYSRKNYLFPGEQAFPHSAVDDERAFLDEMFDGDWYTFGPSKGDHWHVYVADFGAPSDAAARGDQTLEIMMHDIHPAVARLFFRGDDFVSGRDVTERSGIATLLPGSTIDELMFDPCGYSMNGLLDGAYWTIHITPEEHCSYISFETNAVCDYAALIERVFTVFRPGRAIVTMNTSAASACAGVRPQRRYGAARQRHASHASFDGDYEMHVGCYTRVAASPRALEPERWQRLLSLGTVRSRDDLLAAAAAAAATGGSSSSVLGSIAVDAASAASDRGDALSSSSSSGDDSDVESSSEVDADAESALRSASPMSSDFSLSSHGEHDDAAAVAAAEAATAAAGAAAAVLATAAVLGVPSAAEARAEALSVARAQRAAALVAERDAAVVADAAVDAV